MYRQTHVLMKGLQTRAARIQIIEGTVLVRDRTEGRLRLFIRGTNREVSADFSERLAAEKEKLQEEGADILRKLVAMGLGGAHGVPRGQLTAFFKVGQAPKTEG